MSERPIIFSAPMARALLDGRKTQTRRVIPAAHPRHPHHNQIRMDVVDYDPQRPEVWYWDGVHDRVGASYPLPYARGQRLWVREAFRVDEGGAIYDAAGGVMDAFEPCVVYRASSTDAPGRWRPSLHMPRWASRLTLTVTDVRVQRLQEISGMDAVREGVSVPVHLPQDGADLDYARREFITLWNSLHGPDAWAANPWVAAISFTVERRNIDARVAA